MSIRTKVISCLFVIVALFISVTTHSYMRSKKSSYELKLIADLFLPFSRHVAQLQSSVQSLSEDMRRFYLSPQDADSTVTRMVRDFYPYLIEKRFSAAELLLSKHDQGAEKKTVAELGAELAEAKAGFARVMSSVDKASYESAMRSLKANLTLLSQKMESESQRVIQEAQKDSRETLLSGIIFAAVTVLVGSLAILIANKALTPLPLFLSSIKKISEGDFQQSLKLNNRDKGEIALLAREYNRMLEGLRERDARILDQQKELLKAERLAAIGQLSAEIVHEIRNPLNAISLNIDWLESELTQVDPEITKTLRSISRETERLHQITESYLVRARVPVEGGQTTPVNDLLQEILDFSREENRARSIEVVSDFSDNEIFVRTERGRLKQAFLNVMKNATEAMPMGGKLLVKTEIKDNTYRVQFSDTGYGMNEVMRRQVFQPFFTTKTNGTGLGLMLTKNIAEEALGSLHCESHVGEGTTFTFSFPV